MLREVAAAVRVFVCALVCANRANRVALVAAQGRHSRLAFVESESDEYRKDANAVAEEVERAVLQSVSSAEHVSAAAGMGGALALALCYAHKLRLARPQLAPTRFLVVSCSPGCFVFCFVICFLFCYFFFHPFVFVCLSQMSLSLMCQ